MITERLLSTSMQIASEYLLNLKPAQIKTLPSPSNPSGCMLYIHVPFCETLCTYCSFNRFVFRENLAREYFKALRKEMTLAARQGFKFDSMYVGGGTPTILVDELIKTIQLARDELGVKDVSCETNPNHLTPQLVDQLGGVVQRMSVGVQSFDDALLSRMNRLERFGTGEQVLAQIQSVAGGFSSLNVDMIFNIPGQSRETLLRDIDMVLESGTNQTTFYPLMVSPSVRKAMENNMGRLDYNQEYEFYKLIVDKLAPNFQLSTAWTFSHKKETLIDEYIVESEEYLGLGSGSFSYLNGELFVSTFSIPEYIRRVNEGLSTITGAHRFSRREQMYYSLMMDMFGLNVNSSKYRARYGKSLESLLPLELGVLNAFGALKRSSTGQFNVTPLGRYYTVVMMREFFAGINRVRDQARKSLNLDSCAIEKQTLGTLNQSMRP